MMSFKTKIAALTIAFQARVQSQAFSCLVLGCVLLSSVCLVSCGEPVGSETSFTAPRVYIRCTSANCMHNTTIPPRIFALFTTSGCTVSPDYGATLSATVTNISCSSSFGCSGEISGWTDSNGNSDIVLPSGTYSICARIDYNHDYPASTSGDSYGILDTVTINAGTGPQTVDVFTDL